MPPGAPSGDLAGHYEALRYLALSEGVPRAGLGAALLVARGMAAWVAGWRACVPPAARPAAAVRTALPAEVVGVLAAMALACT